MKVAAFCGSARKDGNTAILVNHVFRELENAGIETEMFQLAGKNIRGCIACYKCWDNKDRWAGMVSRANEDMLRRKVGAAVVVHRRGGAIRTLQTLTHFFLIGQMIVPGSGYSMFGVGRDIGEVEKDEEGMLTMKQLGQNMAWVMKRLYG
jgi:multimeric flavodoxin WrbA